VPHPRRTGFTLIEMMVTLAIIGLSMSVIFGFGANMLPQARLAASAKDIGSQLQWMRNHALMTQREVVFRYDLDEDFIEAFYPFEQDDEGQRIGPGTTPVLDPLPMRAQMVIDRVTLSDGSVRKDGQVELHISRLGRIAPHEVLVLNPDYPEHERITVVIDSLSNDYTILDGVQQKEREEIGDADFR
jgi:prepilin-type N-terminal cleavage/methylation domain-containing protein